ncbi:MULTISPECIES: DUF1796 family putative cysteine peptidase [Acinetobacter]|uniref:DUF4214 domain-containing protein n=1 Tax=Acinetobacter chengduensis TaxID=2420890 RepID=A0ABX9TY92_9GAMM|nr:MULTISPECIES: DUF1796 family putative cysteine peptidase [Acinetobacter]MBI1450688.1 DUF4214 domain-containing protein [Acinetobacter sp. FL51]RKG40772.1 DUF4214 domain-containing protein [Acinetobacter sp. WCHAc060007]RLL22848.1 DUF4214 domain-containing protein [Acinetobacter chengduensis]
MPSLTKEQHQIFVENLYRVILEREPDQQGLANHVNFLDNVGFEQGVKTLLSAFIQSEEYKNKLIKNSDDEIKQKFLNDFVWTQNLTHKKEINHIISMGDHCLTSFLLKKYKLKKYSLPFDWIFSNLDAVLHSIENDFNIFLDKQYYLKADTEDGRDATHHFFYEKQFGVLDPMFNHLDITQEEHYQYTLRSVQRFRKVLASEEAKLFIYIARPEEEIEDKLAYTVELLSKYTCNFQIIFIKLGNASQKFNEFQLTNKVLNEHKYYYYQPVSQENGVDFADPFDDVILLRILNEFNFKLNNI